MEDFKKWWASVPHEFFANASYYEYTKNAFKEARKGYVKLENVKELLNNMLLSIDEYSYKYIQSEASKPTNAPNFSKSLLSYEMEMMLNAFRRYKKEIKALGGRDE